MTQRSLAIAAVLGALIIAAALIYHARQVAEVTRRLEAMEQRTTGLDSRLEKFSSELPSLVEQAGNNAGRQAVRGMVQEVVEMPLKWLAPKPASGASNDVRNAVSSLRSSVPAADQGGSWVRFDIQEPVIKIEVLPNLKEVPAIPWLPTESSKRTSPETNQARSAAAARPSGAEAK